MAVVEVPFTVPSGKVAADISGFPVMVDLADLPAEFWANVAADGGDVRVLEGATELPVDVVSIDTGADTGRLFFRADLLAASDNVFTIKCGSGSAKPAAGDPIGRNAVWSGFHRMFDAAEWWVDRTGNGAGLLTFRLPGFRFGSRTLVLTPPNHSSSNYAQGVTGDGTHFYVSQTNYLYKYDASWSLVASDADPIDTAGLSASCDHMSDICHYDGKIYVPMTNDRRPARPDNEHIAVFDASTLAHITNYALPTDASTASICYVPTLNEFWTIDYWDDVGKIQRYSPAFSLLGEITPSYPIAQAQGIEYYNGRIYVTSDNDDHIFELLLDGTVIGVVDTQSESRQGIHITSGGTVFVAAGNTTNNQIYTQAFYDGVTPTGSLEDWLSFSSEALNPRDYAIAVDVGTFTTWTVSASVYAFSKNTSVNHAYLSYSNQFSNTDGSRATLAYRGASNRLAAWDSSNSWLVDSGAVMAVETLYRTALTFNGTTDRKLWINGTLSATDAGTTQRPTGTGDVQGLLLGRGRFNNDEVWPGRINWVYLHPSVLSSDWLDAEADNWNDPTTFATVGAATVIADEVDGDLSELLDGVALDALVSVPFQVDVSATLDNVALSSAVVLAGGGSVALIEVSLDEASLAAAVTVSNVADLAAALDDAALAAFAIAGTNGPFTRRPLIVFN